MTSNQMFASNIEEGNNTDLSVKDKDSGDDDNKNNKTSFLRRRNRSRNNTTGPRFVMDKKCWTILTIFGVLAVIIAIILLAVSIKKVEENNYGVEYNIHKKQLDDAAKSGGLFVGPPGYRFVKFPSTYNTVDLDDLTCVSRDGLRVQVSVTFQYQMTNENMVPAIIKYRDFYKWAKIVEAAGLSAIHHSCSEYVVSDFQNLRGEIQNKMEENLTLKLEGGLDPNSNAEEEAGRGSEGVYARAVSLQLKNVEIPQEYQSAVTAKQSAQEDISLAKNQRKQETTKAETELLKAQEEARKILDTAHNEADLLLTEAKLQAEATTFSFEKEAEAIVEVKESLNLTTEGVLAYLANSLLSEVENLKVTSGEPAKLSRSEEL